jgi:hypothetical protein
MDKKLLEKVKIKLASSKDETKKFKNYQEMLAILDNE